MLISLSIKVKCNPNLSGQCSLEPSAPASRFFS
jgi:hypothetical protein